MSATYAETRGHEVYVYVRGILVMKRWLNHGIDATFASPVLWSNDGRAKASWLGTVAL